MNACLATLARPFILQLDHINKAIRDLESAQKTGNDTEKKLHPQLAGVIAMQLSRAYIMRSTAQGHKIPSIAIMLSDDAEEYVDRARIDDPYARHLVTGSVLNFSRDLYHSEKARGLSTQGRAGAALQELATMQGLREKAIGKHLSRNQAWIDIITADVYIGLEQFDEAARLAKKALAVCQDINSVTNLAIITDLHGRLLQSPANHKSDVRELGDMLREITDR